MERAVPVGRALARDGPRALTSSAARPGRSITASAPPAFMVARSKRRPVIATQRTSSACAAAHIERGVPPPRVGCPRAGGVGRSPAARGRSERDEVALPAFRAEPPVAGRSTPPRPHQLHLCRAWARGLPWEARAGLARPPVSRRAPRRLRSRGRASTVGEPAWRLRTARLSKAARLSLRLFVAQSRPARPQDVRGDLPVPSCPTARRQRPVLPSRSAIPIDPRRAPPISRVLVAPAGVQWPRVPSMSKRISTGADAVCLAVRHRYGRRCPEPTARPAMTASWVGAAQSSVRVVSTEGPVLVADGGPEGGLQD